MATELPHAHHFTELIVWQKARSLSQGVFKMSQSFPAEEKYSLTDQIRRSSRSIGAQIAEAWAKRRYERHFISKMSDADGEQYETQHWLIVTHDSGYGDVCEITRLGKQCKEVGAMVGKMISRSDQFCGDPGKSSAAINESPPLDFFVTKPSDLL